MIELASLNKVFQDRTGSIIPALSDVSLSVPSGHVHGVIGRSGAGKSTLIRCVNLLEQPDSGTVSVAGQVLTGLDAPQLRTARRQIGMIFQHFNLLSTQTVAANVAFPLRLAGMPTADSRRRVAALLDRVGLADKVNAYPAQLSGGQKQRVAIARALASKPSVLLCDEMTSALDPESTQSILQLLRDIQSELSLTVLLITHEMDVIKALADEVTVMDQGCVIEQGPTARVFSAPEHAVTKQLVDSTEHMLLPDGVAERIELTASEGSAALLELSFAGKTAANPVISASVTRFGIEISILQANLSYLRDVLVGKMLVGCCLEPERLQELIAFYEQAGITVEKKGYVRRDNWPLY